MLKPLTGKPSPSITRTVRRCLNCKSEFETLPSYLRKGGGKYCGSSCFAIHSQRRGGHALKTGTMKHRGYVLEWAPKHPANVKGYVYQHRLVMERVLKRRLTASEVVHHKNHKRDDNRLRNLEVMSASEHAEHHHTKFRVRLYGQTVSYVAAARILEIGFSSVKRMRKKRGWTHQQVISHYAKNGRAR